MKALREIIITVLLALLIFGLLQVTIQAYTVRYSCMLPNIRDGEWIVVNKAAYFFGSPQRGEVIVFQSPNNPEDELIKRVIALPGDSVEVKDGKVFVNGIALVEPYILEPPKYTYSREEVLPDNYFVLGDNRNNSLDSHYGWTVPRDNITGRAWFTYWPPSEWGLIKRYASQIAESGREANVMVWEILCLMK